MKHSYYDIIIGGGGAAGRILLFFLSKQPSFLNKSILFLESSNDLAKKTWSFWHNEKIQHPFEELISKKWHNLTFADQNFITNQNISPYVYSCIRGVDFDEFFTDFFKCHTNVKYISATIQNVSHSIGGTWAVYTEFDKFLCNKFISNLPVTIPSDCLVQQFYGEYVKFKDPIFNPDSATLMDFSVDFDEKFGFFYLLPFDERTALVECTFFHKENFDRTKFKSFVDSYMKQKFTYEYETISNEYGCIPLIDQLPKSSDNIILIGQSAGMIKPSTGYAFQRMIEDSFNLARTLYSKKKRRMRSSRFLFYDRLLLTIIRNNPLAAIGIFKLLFKRKKIKHILDFLNEDTSFIEELLLFFHLPWKPFVSAFKKKYE